MTPYILCCLFLSGGATEADNSFSWRLDNTDPHKRYFMHELVARTENLKKIKVCRKDSQPDKLVLNFTMQPADEALTSKTLPAGKCIEVKGYSAFLVLKITDIRENIIFGDANIVDP